MWKSKIKTEEWWQRKQAGREDADQWFKVLKAGLPGGPVARTLCCQCRGRGQGTRSHVPQRRVHMSQLKIPCATAKTQENTGLHEARAETTRTFKRSRLDLKEALRYWEVEWRYFWERLRNLLFLEIPSKEISEMGGGRGQLAQIKWWKEPLATTRLSCFQPSLIRWDCPVPLLKQIWWLNSDQLGVTTSISTAI